VEIYPGTLQVGASENTTEHYQLFGWVPVYDKELRSDERLLITTKISFDYTTSYVEGGMDYEPDSDETLFIIPFV
jgi:hypothetical protein